MQVSFRNLIALLLAKFLIGSGFVRHAKKKLLNGEYILSICFHQPTKEEFESSVKWLKTNNFLFLSTSDLEKIIKGERSFPKGGVLITVDDGWLTNEEYVVAIANKYEIPVTIFVSTEPVEKGTFWWTSIMDLKHSYERKPSLPELKKISNRERLLHLKHVKRTQPMLREAMTKEQIQNIAASKYICIGGHTHSHPILTNCDDDELTSEVQLSKQKLEHWIGKEVCYFAYPNGDHTTREIKKLKESSYRLAFGIHEKYLTPEELKAPYSIPRFCFVEGASFDENICRMLGIWKFTKIWLKQRFMKMAFIS